jgi:hypothetical protein
VDQPLANAKPEVSGESSESALAEQVKPFPDQGAESVSPVEQPPANIERIAEVANVDTHQESIGVGSSAGMTASESAGQVDSVMMESGEPTSTDTRQSRVTNTRTEVRLMHVSAQPGIRRGHVVQGIRPTGRAVAVARHGAKGAASRGATASKTPGVAKHGAVKVHANSGAKKGTKTAQVVARRSQAGAAKAGKAALNHVKARPGKQASE